MTIPVLVILVLLGLMQAATSFDTGIRSGQGGTLLAFGFLLLLGHLAGLVFNKIRLPKLTGYIAAGIAVGPDGLQLLGRSQVDNLQIFNGVAISLIALTAGNELELRTFKPLLRTVWWITLIAVIGTAALLGVSAFLLRDTLPFLTGLPLAQSSAIAGVLGVVMAAQSPAVVVALRDELQADGPVARTVLAVVVIADLVVILLFAGTSAAARATFGLGADVLTTLLTLGWEVFGSLGLGGALGALLAVYLRRVKGGEALFVLAVSFVGAEVGRRLGLDPLLLSLSAGLVVRNTSPFGPALQAVIETSSLPVYVVFFAVAGASIHLGVLGVVGPSAAVFVLVRGLGLFAGSRIGATLAGAAPAVRKYAGAGLLPQAGLALALALLFADTFPELGESAGALVLGVVALNELIAPALYRSALIASGEAGTRVRPRAH